MAPNSHNSTELQKDNRFCFIPAVMSNLLGKWLVPVIWSCCFYMYSKDNMLLGISDLQKDSVYIIILSNVFKYTIPDPSDVNIS